MPLADRAIINLKPAVKAYKKYDAGGLHLFDAGVGGLSGSAKDKANSFALGRNKR